MKNKSQFSAKNQKNSENRLNFFEKDILLFDVSYLLRIVCTSTLITLILIIIWQIHKPSQQLSQEKLDIKVESKKVSESIVIKPSSPESQSPHIDKLVYNVKVKPQIHQSKDLQKIVDEVVKLASNKGLSTTPLSVTLINLKTGEEASYQQEEPRYPASVVKLYWLVMLQAQLQQKGLIENEQLSLDLQKMIKKSDNEAASRILDRITDTESGSNLNTEEFEHWLYNRKQTNQFFMNARYENLNISQKTFPIPYLKLYSPQGRELQMRQNPNQPIRNKITTKQTSRLMYEIVKHQAVSSDKSSKMLELLSIDAATRIKNKVNKDPNIFNTVRGFFSESLPNDIYFAAKAGWTSEFRGETAYIVTSDKKTGYILTIFAEDYSYAHDWNIFPQMSRLVFDNMN